MCTDFEYRLRFSCRSCMCAGLLVMSTMMIVGCSRLGPSSLKSGRMAYNDAIVATNSEQMLAMIVRTRYQEPVGLLAVASITAGVRIQGNLAGQFGVGAQSSYAGNLVPLAAGMVYEESPTITYTNVQGETYLRQVLTPIPIDLTVLAFSALGDSTMATMMLVRRINGVRNVDHAADGDAAEGEKFSQVAELLRTLHRRGWLIWAQGGVQESGEKPSLAMLLSGQGPEYEAQVRQLHELLGLGVPQHLDVPLTMPLHMGVGERPPGAVEIVTRSAYDLLQVAAAGVDVPLEHIESGLARQMIDPGPASKYMRIVRTASQPTDALVAIRHHDWWYSIDGHDQESKAAFRLLESLITARIADSAATQSAMPILTIPAAR